MADPTLTEPIVYGLLRDLHRDTGNGGSGRAAVLAQVRNAAGFGATRTYDAVVVDLWPSRGLTIHVHEIKVSRSDWQRELAKPAKAEDACKVADRFSVVAPKGCVKPGELPPTWGLIEVHGDGTDAKPWRLRTKTAAPLLHDEGARPVPRGLLVGLLRSCPGAIPGHSAAHTDTLLAEARREGYESGKAAAEQTAQWQAKQDRSVAAAVEKMASALTAAGTDPWDATPEAIAGHADRVAAAIRGDRTDRALADVAGQLRRTLALIEDGA